MNKCHHIHDEKHGKILIPFCWAVVISGNMRDCTCRNTFSFKQFEKQEFNEILREKERYILELEREINQKNRVIGKLLKSKT